MLQAFFRHVEAKIEGALSSVEENPAFARLPDFRKYFSVCIQNAVLAAVKTMREYVSFPQHLQNVRQWGVRTQNMDH